MGITDEGGRKAEDVEGSDETIRVLKLVGGRENNFS
jgi:hypothetical protein